MNNLRYIVHDSEDEKGMQIYRGRWQVIDRCGWKVVGRMLRRSWARMIVDSLNERDQRGES